VTRFTSLSYENPRDLVFGRAKQPLRYGLGLEVGAGRVIPELKYWPRRGAEEAGKLVEEFTRITKEALERAVDLGAEALQLETELSYKATMQPKLAREIVEAQRSVMEDYHSEYGITLALRVTVADIRWSKSLSREEALALMMEAFEEVAAAGADVLSIESIGGKEVFDYSIIRGDLEGIALSLGILAPIDVERLWRDVVRIAARHGVIAGGDTACGFANTAMKLAGGLARRMVPHTLAAIVRAMSIPRTLKAYEVGAKGPGKDCAYENVAIKAITGYPMSMEGKASAVAHSSLLGNVAAAACDLWSNEQVENLKLFGGTGPQVFLEILHYDCELMNAALRTGRETMLRDLMVESDAWRDPQALILAPPFAWEIARVVVEEGDDYRRAVRAGIRALQLIETEWRKGRLRMDDREAGYMLRLKRELERLPSDAEDLLDRAGYYESKIESFKLSNYF